MPFDLDTTEAPALLKVRCYGTFPRPSEQETTRQDLIDKGLLTEGTVSLLDCRDVDAPDAMTLMQTIAAAVRAGKPRRRAFLLNPGKHLHLLQQFQEAVPWMSAAAFIDEREAIEWLLNPEGSVGFKQLR